MRGAIVLLFAVASAQEYSVSCFQAGRLLIQTSGTTVVSFLAPFQGNYIISTCGTNYDTQTIIEGAGVPLSDWRDDDGACHSNQQNEVYNQMLLKNENYNITVKNRNPGTSTQYMVLSMTCPTQDESLTFAPTMVGQTPPIRCGETDTLVLNGNTRWQPYILDLSLSQGNTRVNLNTCKSRTRNPKLCLNTEFIDDDQYETGQGTGDCTSRPSWSTNMETRLAEDVTYVLSPRMHHIQVRAEDGSNTVVLIVACAPTSSPATVLRSNQSECYNSHSDLFPFDTDAPTREGETLPPSARPTFRPTAPPTPAPPTRLPTTRSPTMHGLTVLPTSAPAGGPIFEPTSAPTGNPMVAPTPPPTSRPIVATPTPTGCEQYQNNCVRCLNAFACTVCNNTYLYNGVCFTECPAGYIADNGDHWPNNGNCASAPPPPPPPLPPPPVPPTPPPPTRPPTRLPTTRLPTTRRLIVEPTPLPTSSQTVTATASSAAFLAPTLTTVACLTLVLG